jgi:hypothetical protein
LSRGEKMKGTLARVGITLALVAANVAMIAQAAGAQEEGCHWIDLADEAQTEETIEGLQAESWFFVAGDGAEALYSPACSTSAEFVDSLPDVARWNFYYAYGLPEAPEGYYWIMDDLTLEEEL